MTENPQDKESIPPKEEKKRAEDEKNAWAEDQKERGYYYDDAHGYEIFKDEDDEED